MMHKLSVLVGALGMVASATSSAQGNEQEIALESAQSVAEAGGVKTMSGMSILGNEEAPKSLVIVPWKSSQLGDGLGVGNGLDDQAKPIDKEVFMRELRYYELRSGGAD